MGKTLDQVMRYVETLNMQQWALILAAMVIMGLLCMRGFGSRSDY